MFFFVLLLLVCVTLCPFKFCNNLDEEETADYFVFIVLMISCFCYVLWHFLSVPWIGLQCVIVIFPDHTHLKFDF